MGYDLSILGAQREQGALKQINVLFNEEARRPAKQFPVKFVIFKAAWADNNGPVFPAEIEIGFDQRLKIQTIIDDFIDELKWKYERLLSEAIPGEFNYGHISAKSISFYPEGGIITPEIVQLVLGIIRDNNDAAASEVDAVMSAIPSAFKQPYTSYVL